MLSELDRIFSRRGECFLFPTGHRVCRDCGWIVCWLWEPASRCARARARTSSLSRSWTRRRVCVSACAHAHAHAHPSINVHHGCAGAPRTYNCARVSHGRGQDALFIGAAVCPLRACAPKQTRARMRLCERRDDFRATMIRRVHSRLIECNSVLSSLPLPPSLSPSLSLSLSLCTRVVKIPFLRDFKHPRAEIASTRHDETVRCAPCVRLI